MAARTSAAAARTKKHQPSDEGAATAQGASQPDPQRDVESQAADAQTGTMAAQEPGPFDPAKFKADVKKTIEGMAPPATLEEADEFKESGKANQAAPVMHGIVTGGRAASEAAIKGATEADPDTAGLQPKPVGEMVNDEDGPFPGGIAAADAMPKARPAAETDLSAGPAEIDARMAEANVTEAQLAESNEPEFTGALESRAAAAEHSATAPAVTHQQEAEILAAGRGQAELDAAGGAAGMHGARSAALSTVLGDKDVAKLADQQLRDDLHTSILAIHSRTQIDVTTLLKVLDARVDQLFTDGEKEARDAFESYVDRKMRAYKADRYGGLLGPGYWLKDKAFDLPDEVNAFYRDGRRDYLTAMDGVIDRIAVVVGEMLTAAHARIQAGRDEVTAFIGGLDTSVQELATTTAADLDGRFDQLTADVDSKRDELVDAVARRYVDSTKAVDERIKELQEANKGFVSKAIDAIAGVIKTIYELGKLLVRVLLKAASAIGDIIAHPIRFLETLVDGVKGGLERFVSRIGEHLKNALVNLLFGELGSSGIKVPGTLDFAGVLDLVLQVLGVTYDAIRERVVRQFGEENVQRMEQTLDVFKILASEGVAGLWTWIQEKVTDLYDLVIGKIEEHVIERVIKAGISYILSLLNPVAAFIKACMGIYEIVMFVVEKAKQIATFVDAVLDSISAMAAGDSSVAAAKVEEALASGLTLAIGFLARLANLGALSEKVRSVIEAVRRPITRAVDLVVNGAAKAFRRVAGVALGRGKKDGPQAPGAGGPTQAAEPAPSPEESAAEQDPKLAKGAQAAKGQWIHEHAEGGHTIRVAPDLTVHRFSSRTQLSRQQAAAQLDHWLTHAVKRTPMVYPPDGLGRAAGPSGLAAGVKKNGKRDAMLPVGQLPGGVAAYEPGDVRGHLVGDRFHGIGTGGNLVPMHPHLNGSVYLSFENKVADEYWDQHKATGAARVWMQVIPSYPAADPTRPGRHFRPTSFDAHCIVYGVENSGGTLALHQVPFQKPFDNFSTAGTPVNVNDPDPDKLRAVFSGTLTDSKVKRLIAAIVSGRPYAGIEDFGYRAFLRLPPDEQDLYRAIVNSRSAQLIVARFP